MKKIFSILLTAGMLALVGFFPLAKTQAASIVTLAATALPHAKVGYPYSASVAFTNSGNGTTTYALNGTWTGLPNGIIGQGFTSDPNHVYGMLGSSGNFTLSGTATQAGTYNVSLSIDDQYGATATQNFVLYVDGPATIQINSSTIPAGLVGTSYYASIPYTYNGSYALNATWTGLPPGIIGQGLASDPNHVYGLLGNSVTVLLQGTPTQAGVYSAHLSMTDQYGATADKYFSIIVSTPGSLTITGTSLPSATVGQSYSATIPYSYSGSPALNATWTGLPNGIIGQGLPSDPNHVIGLLGNSLSLTLSGMPTQSGTYTVNLQMTDQGSLNVSKQFALVVNPTSPATTLQPMSGSAHANYTNVVGPDGTVYRIDGSARYPYTSAGAFLSYGFNTWATVVPATSGDMALPVATYTPSGSTQQTTYFIPPRNGSLINDKGTIYLITNGTRVGFANAQSFLELGYSFANAQPGDTSFMVTLAPINNSATAHPDGTLIRDGKTIYLLKNNTRLGIPSMSVFYSWGLNMNEVVPANNYDLAAPVSGVLNTRMENQLSI